MTPVIEHSYRFDRHIPLAGTVDWYPGIPEATSTQTSQGDEAVAPHHMYEADDTRFAAYVVRRITKTKYPYVRDARKAVFVPVEVVIDLLLASVPPAAFDSIFSSIKDEAAKGDPSAEYQKRILDRWAAGKMSGRATSIAEVAPQHDRQGLVVAADKLTGNLLTLVADSNPYRGKVVTEVLIAEDGKGNFLGTSCLVYLATVTKNMKSTAEHNQMAAELAKCRRYLQEHQGLLEMHRLVPASDGLSRAIMDSLAKSGQLEKAAEFHSERDRTIERLMKTYGECVNSVPGADPQDLFFLYRMGMISDLAA